MLESGCVEKRCHYFEPLLPASSTDPQQQLGHKSMRESDIKSVACIGADAGTCVGVYVPAQQPNDWRYWIVCL